jgi:hypothetical protein
MRLMTSVVRLALTGAVIGLTACSDGGGGSDAGLDGSTDTDTDADTDVDTDTDTYPFTDNGTACVVYVNGAYGDDGKAGESWASALATVQAGLNLAAGAGCDVWVMDGTYLPTEDPTGDTAPDDDRTKTILLQAGVALYGGFAGHEMNLSERDVVANETILSGDIGVSGDNSDNSYHVVTGADDATIDGFTITGGNADSGGAGNGGGGMYNDSSSPIVTSCTFSGNVASAGGGMYNGSSPTVTNCTLSGNSAGSGGGMYNESYSSPTVTNCTFSGNSAGSGGGMHNNSHSSPTVTSCTFSGNTAADYGGGMANYGAFPTVTNCTFSGNSAADFGGGMGNSTSETAVSGIAYLANCILWGDTDSSGANEISGYLFHTHVSYSVVQGGFTGDGNIDLDPLFVHDDPYAGVVDLHLQEGSPCIDTGSNDAVPEDLTTDLDGNPRIVDGNDETTATVDMGAYEYQP